MSYPAKSPPAVTPANWNAMVDAVNGVTIDGVRAYHYNYLIRSNGGVYEAIDYAANLAFGGTSDAGGIDGDDLAAVEAACVSALSGGIILMQDVAHNHSQVLPANVTVIENKNGAERAFIDDASSINGYYTVTIGAGDDAGKYFCQDSQGRYINPYTSTNSSTTIQYAIDNIATYGTVETVGEITLTTSLTFTQKHITFKFERLIIPATVDESVFVINNTWGYDFTLTGKYISYRYLGTATAAVQLTGSGNTINIDILSNLGSGASIALTGGDCYYNRIIVNELMGSLIGISIGGDNNVYAVNNIYVGVHNSVARVTTGFVLTGDYVTSNTFSGSFEGNNVAGNIAFNISGLTTCDSTIINYFCYDVVGAGSYALYNVNTTVHIIGGMMPVLSDYGTMHNDGGQIRRYGVIPSAGNSNINENWGTATITSSTTVDVTHGLATVPCFISITPETFEGYDYWVNTIGLSTFRINVPGSGTFTFFWYARCDTPS